MYDVQKGSAQIWATSREGDLRVYCHEALHMQPGQDAERELQYVPKVEAWEDLSDSDSDAATDDEDLKA